MKIENINNNMNNKKSLKQFKKNINLMFENNDKEIYLHKDDALKIEYYIYSLEQQVKKQKEVIDKVMNLIKKYGKYDGEKCTKGFQMWSADFNKILDILKEVSE